MIVRDNPSRISEVNALESNKSIRVLVVEDSESDAYIVQELLAGATIGYEFEVKWVSQLEAAIEAFQLDRFDVALLDLGLTDSIGIATFEKAKKSLNIPIIVLSGMSDEEMAVQAVKLGAQDYLMKGELNTRHLERSICYAIERSQLVLELESAKERAEAANRAKNQFLAVMSHEFRTPMNGIMGCLNLLRNENISDESSELLEIMHKCANSQLGLITDVLDISRIEAGKLELSYEEFVLNDLITSVFQVLEYKAKTKGLFLKNVVQNNIPLSLVSDHRRLRQILINLIGNAIKFTDKGGVTLKLEFSSSNELIFEIHDTGPGIPRDKQEIVFLPFEQVDSTFKRRYEGTGLGLSICKQLVEALGGTISLQSKVGVGSVFRFSLPVDEARFDCDGSLKMQNFRSRLGSDFCGKYPLEILIVDDNESGLILLERTLKSLGYFPDSVLNGSAAVAKSKEKSFDLILMDLQMPDMDGIEATIEILKWNQERQISAPYIAPVTACVLEEDRIRCSSVGMKSFLSKPFEYEELERLLRDAYKTKLAR